LLCLCLPWISNNTEYYTAISLTDHWVLYDGDGTASRPLLSVRRHASLRWSSKTMAHVTLLGSAAAEYVVEESYGRRACAVRDARGGDAVVAEVPWRRQIGAAAQDLGAHGRSRRQKTCGKGRSGARMACVFLRTGEENSPIVKRWEIRIENYWRVFFFLFFKKLEMVK